MNHKVKNSAMGLNKNIIFSINSLLPEIVLKFYLGVQRSKDNKHVNDLILFCFTKHT